MSLGGLDSLEILRQLGGVGEQEVAIAASRLVCEGRLHRYVKDAWNKVESAPFIDNWHVGAVCEHLQAVSDGQIENLLINIPPGCSKSLVTCVFWPSWSWAKDGGDTRWFFASYDQHLSTRDAVKTKELILSPWFRHRWPEIAFSKRQDEKTYYEMAKGGWRLSTSVGGHGTGEHPDYIVVDDPHNTKKAESEAERLNVIEWWDLTMSLRGLSRGVKRAIIMQRLHENDLSGHVLSTDRGFVHLCLPMRYEPKRMVETPIGWDDPRKRAGELLAPEQFPDEMLKKAEVALGSYGVAGQMQQKPSPGEGGEIKRTWFKYYDPDAEPDYDAEMQSWDTTMGDMETVSPTAAYCVGQVWGRKGSNCYLRASVRSRMDGAETIAAIRNMTIRFPKAHAKLLENKASAPTVKAVLYGEIPGLISQPATQSKEQRVRIITPFLEAGHVFLPGRKTADGWVAAYPWVADFIEECAAFPVGSFKDQVDAMSQALAYLYSGAKAAQREQDEAAKDGPPPTTVAEMKRQARAKQIAEEEDAYEQSHGGGMARRDWYRSR